MLLQKIKKYFWPALGIIFTLAISIYFDNKNTERAQREAEAQKQIITKTESVIIEETQRHYESIQKNIAIRDSIIYERFTSTISQLQHELDSIYNRQPFILDQIGSNKRP